MSADDEMITVGEPLPVIDSVEWLGRHALSVSWAEGPRAGTTDVVELAPAIARYRIFAPLRDDAVFATVRLADDGNALRWDTSGGPVDMAATMVEHHAVLAELDRMTAEGFRGWMDRHGLTLDDAADKLGIARRLVAYYRTGEKKVPRTVALACIGYDAVTHQQAA